MKNYPAQPHKKIYSNLKSILLKLKQSFCFYRIVMKMKPSQFVVNAEIFTILILLYKKKKSCCYIICTKVPRFCSKTMIIKIRWKYVEQILRFNSWFGKYFNSMFSLLNTSTVRITKLELESIYVSLGNKIEVKIEQIQFVVNSGPKQQNLASSNQTN